jgi:hypothetical protein
MSRPGRFIPEIEHRYSTNRRLRGPHSQSGSWERRKIYFLYRDTNPDRPALIAEPFYRLH